MKQNSVSRMFLYIRNFQIGYNVVSGSAVVGGRVSNVINMYSVCTY